MTTDLDHALAALRRKEVIAYPTDTVWGLGCDATQPDAVGRVYALKHRAPNKAMILLFGSIEAVKRHFPGLSPKAVELLLSPDCPTTVILYGAVGIAPEVMAADGSVAVRVTREPFSRELCEAAGVPLVSTSANISGSTTPATFAEIAPEVLDAVSYVCLAGRCSSETAKPSRIVKIAADGDTITTLRP